MEVCMKHGFSVIGYPGIAELDSKYGRSSLKRLISAFIKAPVDPSFMFYVKIQDTDKISDEAVYLVKNDITIDTGGLADLIIKKGKKNKLYPRNDPSANNVMLLVNGNIGKIKKRFLSTSILMCEFGFKNLVSMLLTTKSIK
jgi:hypothetical protein